MPQASSSEVLPFQLDLFSPRAVPSPRQRNVVFFASRMQSLAGEAREAVADLRQRFQLSGRARPESLLHVSLLAIDSEERLDAEAISRLRRAADTLLMPRISVSFRMAMSFGRAGSVSRRPLVLAMEDGGAETIAFTQALERALLRQGLRPVGRPPSLPHLTLLYDRLLVPPTPLRHPITTPLQSIELILSHRGESRYTTLWP